MVRLLALRSTNSRLIIFTVGLPSHMVSWQFVQIAAMGTETGFVLCQDIDLERTEDLARGDSDPNEGAFGEL